MLHQTFQLVFSFFFRWLRMQKVLCKRSWDAAPDVSACVFFFLPLAADAEGPLQEELGCCTRRFSLCFLFSSAGCGCRRSFARGVGMLHQTFQLVFSFFFRWLRMQKVLCK